MMVTLSRLYSNSAQARRVVEELKSAGLREGDIAMLAPARAGVNSISRAAAVGAVLIGLTGFLVGLSSSLLPDIGVVITTGWLASTLMGLVLGGLMGGIAGALVEITVRACEAAPVKRSSTLVSIQVPGHERAFYERLMDAPLVIRRRVLNEPVGAPVLLHDVSHFAIRWW